MFSIYFGRKKCGNSLQSNVEHLEANLCTMLQSVRGSQQYWFVRKSELKCMIREYGSPTLFLTFSCAEYESADIANYLRKLKMFPPPIILGNSVPRILYQCLESSH